MAPERTGVLSLIATFSPFLPFSLLSLGDSLKTRSRKNLQIFSISWPEPKEKQNLIAKICWSQKFVPACLLARWKRVCLLDGRKSASDVAFGLRVVWLTVSQSTDERPKNGLRSQEWILIPSYAVLSDYRESDCIKLLFSACPLPIFIGRPRRVSSSASRKSARRKRTVNLFSYTASHHQILEWTAKLFIISRNSNLWLAIEPKNSFLAKNSENRWSWKQHQMHTRRTMFLDSASARRPQKRTQNFTRTQLPPQHGPQHVSSWLALKFTNGFGDC